mmetsp:Transcript_104292/g.294092  ORF Transcript_104292/g.294092 Transcript_104292/m.294092 type:complete len:176 (-) Transcript_104292:727-1254(-)
MAQGNPKGNTMTPETTKKGYAKAQINPKGSIMAHMLSILVTLGTNPMSCKTAHIDPKSHMMANFLFAFPPGTPRLLRTAVAPQNGRRRRVSKIVFLVLVLRGRFPLDAPTRQGRKPWTLGCPPYAGHRRWRQGEAGHDNGEQMPEVRVRLLVSAVPLCRTSPPNRTCSRRTSPLD